MDMVDGGNDTLVIIHGGFYRFQEHGIKVLLHLVSTRAPQLHTAIVVDKVVGKAAAALLVLGGAAEVYTPLISEGALQLLDEAGLKVTYDRLVPHITNRQGDGWCPMEQACRDCDTPAECLEAIMTQINSMSGHHTSTPL